MADEPNTPPQPSEQQTSQPAPPERTPEPVAQEPQAEQAAESVAEEPQTGQPAEPVAEEVQAAEPAVEESQAAEPAVEESQAAEPVVEEVQAAEPAAEAAEDEEERPAPPPREKPAVPGAHLEVDIVPEGVDPLAPEQPVDPYAIEQYEEEPQTSEEEEEEADDEGELSQPISSVAIDLASGARYRATGKRKTAIARVILRPGSGVYTINGRSLEQHFPRETLQRNIRQPLETVGYQERMDVVARLHGSGISAQAGALRHGISRALLEADPNLRGELKRRGFLTRDSRAKERKKAGLKKARKRPQFSKR
jgi:small subunit ribosomal protein S9